METITANASDSQSDLLRLVPPVLRARGYYLYTQGNAKAKADSTKDSAGHLRLIDLWLEGGAAVLGHKSSRMVLEMKNAAERGLFSPLPHPLEGRFFKALAQLFPGRAFRIYASGGTLRRALDATAPDIALWRPFVQDSDPLAVSAEPVLIPVIPGLTRWGDTDGWPCGPAALAIESDYEKAHPFPPSDLIAPVTLAMACRGIYNLIAAAPERGSISPGIAKALKNSAWRRRGIYLGFDPAPDPAAYAELFRRFLDGGFLLPPDSSQPAILPAGLSPGEEAKLAALLAGI
jgi:hypothetical protein